MSHEDFILGKLYDVAGYFVKLRRILYHVIGNAGELGYKKRNGPLGINQGIKLIDYLFAIVNKNSNFRNSILRRLAASCFNINYCVQNRFVRAGNTASPCLFL